MLKNAAIDKVRLDGGILCLDFVNTIPDRMDGSDRDLLKDIHDLIYWAKKVSILDAGLFTALTKEREKNNRQANKIFSEALYLRSIIYAVFKPICHHKKADKTDLDAFNKLAARYFPFLEIIFQKNRYVEEWNFGTNHFSYITGPIIKSAHELLLSDKLSRIKECPNCGWLFLDTTKNGRRRWCSMEDCGNNVKALEYYYRKRNKPV